MEVIDSHCHIFPPEIIKRRHAIAARDEGFRRIYGNPRARMCDHEALAAYMLDEGVAFAATCGFPFDDGGLVGFVNDYVLEVARTHRNIIPLASINTKTAEGGVREAERCLALGAKGIGEVAAYETGLGPGEIGRLEGVARVVEERGAVLLVHVNEQVGHRYEGKMPVDFAEVSRFLEAHPDLTVILAHLGGGLCFYEFMPEVQRAFSRVYYDTAALPYLYGPEVYRFIGSFLSGKALFGSDYPLLTLKRYRAGMGGLDHEAQEKVMGGNARRIFFDG